ncbi:spermidine/spermine N(1)-acetyltransferase-like protein 1 [Balaenoptera acutorostrata]|uniref:Spermidine/spermine N(1)-acetyltransferase-like protein 1 n=1 Tax=Balaenoptera acutorostrata TaxID=9767 RepID=A0ABM3SUW4_BALAC|nr:spermidine/spermine N(1)-acetyltransferase-like protein 1 [Balaenoptera acutorostrata]
MRQTVVSQSSTTQSSTSQPGLSQSGMSQLQPDPSQSSMSEPGMRQPCPSQSSTNQQGMRQPGPSQSIMSQPGMRQPCPSQSSTSQPGPSQSGTSQTCMSQTGRRQSSMRQPSVNSFRELAACENMLDAMKLTEKDVLRGGFGGNPLFYCLIAEVHNHQKPSGKVTVGFAMYYFTYDPWIGKLLYLEDLHVIQAYRGLGIGAEMLKRLSHASTDYYTHRGALDLSSEEGRHLFRFNREELMDMAGEE